MMMRTWTDWNLIRELLGASGLKNRAVVVVRELTLQGKGR
jgi:hypothetical protein